MAAAVGEKARNYTTEVAEQGKIAENSCLCQVRGIKCLPAVFNSLGGWGAVVLRESFAGVNMKPCHKATRVWYLDRRCSPTRICRNRGLGWPKRGKFVATN